MELENQTNEKETGKEMDLSENSPNDLDFHPLDLEYESLWLEVASQGIPQLQTNLSELGFPGNSDFWREFFKERISPTEAVAVLMRQGGPSENPSQEPEEDWDPYSQRKIHFSLYFLWKKLTPDKLSTEHHIHDFFACCRKVESLDVMEGLPWLNRLQEVALGLKNNLLAWREKNPDLFLFIQETYFRVEFVDALYQLLDSRANPKNYREIATIALDFAVLLGNPELIELVGKIFLKFGEDADLLDWGGRLHHFLAFFEVGLDGALLFSRKGLHSAASDFFKIAYHRCDRLEDWAYLLHHVMEFHRLHPSPELIELVARVPEVLNIWKLSTDENGEVNLEGAYQHILPVVPKEGEFLPLPGEEGENNPFLRMIIEGVKLLGTRFEALVQRHYPFCRYWPLDYVKGLRTEVAFHLFRQLEAPGEESHLLEHLFSGAPGELASMAAHAMDGSVLGLFKAVQIRKGEKGFFQNIFNGQKFPTTDPIKGERDQLILGRIYPKEEGDFRMLIPIFWLNGSWVPLLEREFEKRESYLSIRGLKPTSAFLPTHLLDIVSRLILPCIKGDIHKKGLEEPHFLIEKRLGKKVKLEELAESSGNIEILTPLTALVVNKEKKGAESLSGILFKKGKFLRILSLFPGDEKPFST